MKKTTILIFVLFIIVSLSATTIYDIQYTTNAGDGTYPSPMVDQDVTVTGIVTGNDYGGGKFFISSPEGGEWNGIYIYEWETEPQLGDEVEVSGTVTEYYGFTEIGYANVTILSSGNPVPEPVIISCAVLSTTEAYESVFVRLDDLTVVQGEDDYGQWLVTDGTGICQIDNGFFYLDSADPPIIIEVGDSFPVIKGIVDFSYDNFDLNPRFPEDMFGGTEDFGFLECNVENEAGESLENVQININSGNYLTDDEGFAEIQVPIGVYTVTFSLASYEIYTQNDVEIILNETTELDIVLIEQSTSAIYNIQFTTNAGDGTYPSPMVDQEVTVTGIVTGNDFSGGKFFISSPEGGAWNGIYVYEYETEPQLGDEVEVNGIVTEYYGFTEIGNASVTILSSGNPVPEPVSISCAVLSSEEAYESVLVRLDNLVVVQAQDDYGQWLVTDGTGICQIDNGFFYLDEVDPPIIIEVGDSFSAIKGLVDFSYDEFGLNPRFPEDIIEDVENFGFLECFVENEAGEPLEGVLVSVNAEEYYTNISGTVEISLPVGIYSVTFTLEGYQMVSIDDVEIFAGDETILSVVLIEANPELLPPTNLEVTFISETEALLSWDPPAGDGDEIEEGFDADNLPEGWDIVDNDGDGYNWEVSADWGGNNDSAHCMTSASYRNDVGALFPDNWLISPALAIGRSSELHFWVACQDPAWASEHYYVKVSTSGDEVLDFTETIYEDVLVTDNYTEVVIDLTDFAGETIHLAWQHAECTDWFWMNLDDISVINTATREVSFSANFETVKNIRQFKTGNSLRNENYRDRELIGYNLYFFGELITSGITQTELLLTDLVDGVTYVYAISALYTDGESDIVEIEFVFESTDTIDNGINGLVTQLGSNYPNPFNPETKINFSTKEAGNVIIEIYNPKGQKVKVLTNKSFDAGDHSIIWNGVDDNNNKVSSGVYLYKMKTKEYNSTQKMILMK
ncbi:MAG: choice-of-anchor J domain-containing protein [Candidatus Cloacimonetes bacterium]|nr:choice-of-anchor J domain-containing protein [Candidatus Cloacimonadota bacterium]